MLYSATRIYYTTLDYRNDNVTINYDCSSVRRPSFRSRYETTCNWWVLCNTNQLSSLLWHKDIHFITLTDLFRPDMKTFLFHSVYEHQDTDW